MKNSDALNSTAAIQSYSRLQSPAILLQYGRSDSAWRMTNELASEWLRNLLLQITGIYMADESNLGCIN